MDHRLYDAARTGDINTLHSLLQEDALVLDRVSLSSPENPLHVSAFAGQAAFAAEILRLKPDFAKVMNHQGFSPLHIASAAGHLGVVREVMRVGRDVCLLKGKDGLTPLHCAAMTGRSDVVEELVSLCPESLKEVTASHETALHVAVKSSQVEAARVLLNAIKRLDVAQIVNWQNREGNTALHLATLTKQLEIVEMLIADEAIIPGVVEVNIRNSSGFTPKDILDVVLLTEAGNPSEIYKLLQIFQKVEAMNSKEIVTNPISGYHHIQSGNAHPLTSIRPTWLRMLWSILDYEVKGSTGEGREMLMVVAVLIATVTYQGILQPPGGFRSEDSGAATAAQGGGSQNNTAVLGPAIMSNEVLVFTCYTVFNAIGFLASMAMISLLTRGIPLRNWMRLCVLSMMATYVITVVYIAPRERYLVWTVLPVMALIVLRELVLFFKTLFRLLKGNVQKKHGVR